MPVPMVTAAQSVCRMCLWNLLLLLEFLFSCNYPLFMLRDELNSMLQLDVSPFLLAPVESYGTAMEADKIGDKTVWALP